MTRLTLAVIAATSALVPTAASAAPPPGPLDALVGTWKATGTATMGPDTAKVSATWKCARVSAGAGVECKLRLTGVPGMVLEETDLFGVDPMTKRVHWFAVTNAGEVHDHAAALTDGAWQFSYDGTQDGKPMHEGITLTMAPDRRSFRLTAQVAVGGAAVFGFDIAAKK